ncbi:hypothetical protein ACWGB8_03280 [Kitasatospora sp. NPDC054939]
MSVPSSWSFGNGLFARLKGMAQANSTAGTLAAGLGSKDVKVELESLEAFRKKVTQLLSELEGTPASPFALQGQNLSAGNLGTGFSESTDLMSAYDRVQPVLVTMCKALIQQIDGMIKALGATAANYGGNESQQTANVKAAGESGSSGAGKGSF